MTTSREYEFGTVAYWRKRAHTKQQIIDRQRAKITRLERQLAATQKQNTHQTPAPGRQTTPALADIPNK